MSQAVIKAEHLGKKYMIGHQQKERYTALRDVIANNVKSVFRKTRDLVTGNYQVEGDSAEEFWALKNIEFEIHQGARVGIIGRNGAGKSTLLKLLSRITEPTEGKITLRGRVASLLEVGTGFHPELTGRENIFLNGAILGMNRAEIRSKFDEIVAFAEVEKFLDTPVKRYSSGMYVRLAFAVAAHLEPEILVVDEVLAVGDAQFQKKCLGKMEQVSKGEGRTVLFVSHNMDAISNLCNQCILLNKGTVIFDGDVQPAISLYQANNQSSAGHVWNNDNPENDCYIKSAAVQLNGEQPYLKLVIDVELASKVPGKKPAFIAFDIHNSMNVTVMQALPVINPFIQFGNEPRSYKAEIDLVGLIPDNYTVSVWIGPHNSETYDWQKNILGFEISQSPTEGRTFPHHYGHGYIVPVCRITEK